MNDWIKIDRKTVNFVMIKEVILVQIKRIVHKTVASDTERCFWVVEKPNNTAKSLVLRFRWRSLAAIHFVLAAEFC
jgi:hypothetical protein